MQEASEHIKFLEKQLEINKQRLKFCKITAVGLGISHGSTLAFGVIEYLRGSNVKSLANYTKTDFKEFQPLIDELKASTGLRTLEVCNIPSGLSFVNNVEFGKYVMKHIKNLHRYKQVGNVVVLSSAALCFLYNNFIQEFAWVRVISNVSNRAEIRNVKQFVRRGIVVITWAAGAGLINFLELPLVVLAIYSGAVAMGNSFLGSTSTIPIEKAKSDVVAMARRPDMIDIMGLNLDKFILNFIKYFEENWVSSKELVSLASAALECFLPDQIMANANCKNNTTKEEILSNIPHILDKFLEHFLKARIDPEKIVTAKNVAVDSSYPVKEIGQDEAEIKLLKAILEVRGGHVSISPAVFVNRDPIFWFIHLEKLKRQYNRAVFDFLTPASKFIVKKSKKVAQQTKKKIQKISQTKYRIKRIKSN